MEQVALSWKVAILNIPNISAIPSTDFHIVVTFFISLTSMTKSVDTAVLFEASSRLLFEATATFSEAPETLESTRSKVNANSICAQNK